MQAVYCENIIPFSNQFSSSPSGLVTGRLAFLALTSSALLSFSANLCRAEAPLDLLLSSADWDRTVWNMDGISRTRREYLEFSLDILGGRCGSSRALEVRMFWALSPRLLQHELVTHTSRLGQLRHLGWLTRGSSPDGQWWQWPKWIYIDRAIRSDEGNVLYSWKLTVNLYFLRRRGRGRGQNCPII